MTLQEYVSCASVSTVPPFEGTLDREKQSVTVKYRKWQHLCMGQMKCEDKG